MNLSVRGLSRSYTNHQVTTQALTGIDLTIERGEFVAIVGTSGSGKTTLLNTLSGLDTGFEGTVKLGDQTLNTLTEPALATLRNRHIGFVFQAFNLLDHLTAVENVALPGFFGPPEAKPTDKIDDTSRARALLTRVGLADRIDARPPQLSGGQKQRVAIARALFCHPSIIFCDEPTGSLDQKTGLSIMRLFDELNREQDLTLIVVTHEPYIAAMARRRIVLKDGQIVEDQVQAQTWPDTADDNAQQRGAQEATS